MSGQDSDGDGKWYEDEDIKKEENVAEGKKKGLWDNIHAKRKRKLQRKVTRTIQRH